MFTRLKVSVVLLPVALIGLVGVYVYSLWASEQQRATDVPVEATGMMIRDLLSYHKKRGSFPSDLKQMEGVVWEKKRPREFSIENRALSHRNYFYLYTRIDPHKFTLWAVPIGKASDEGATYFLSASNAGYRTWKGPTLSPDSVSSIKVNPTAIDLGTLGLVEQAKVATQSNSR